MSKKKLLVIDTDGVADDVRAISLALQTPDVEVLAITCVTGCVSVQQAVANVARTLRANGKKVPIYKGAEAAIIETLVDRELYFFGADGVGDKPEHPPKMLQSDFDAHEKGIHAALALIEIFEKTPNTTLVCIGPLTNVALALKLEPKFAQMPEQLVILGGNMYGMGNVTSYSTAEFNFGNDPEAAYIVLKEMQCLTTLVPWETFMLLSETEKTPIDFHAHLFLDHPLSRYFNAVTYEGRVKLERADKQYAYCDEVAVAVAINPEGIIKETKHFRATVELHGTHTRGQVAMDWFEKIFHEDEKHPGICKKRRHINVVTKYDVKLLDEMIFQAIKGSKLNELNGSA